VKPHADAEPDASREGARLARRAARLRARARKAQPRKRMALCGLYAVGDGDPCSIEIEDRADGTRRAWWRRVKLCQRPGCPVCARRKSAINRAKAEAALRGRGGIWTLVTLTVPHAAGEPAADVLDRLTAALRRWRASRAIRRLYELHVEASIRATEVTRGARGWHWHIHLLLATDVRRWSAWDLATAHDSWCRISGAKPGIGLAFSEPYDCDRGLDRERAASYVGKAGCEVAGIAKAGSRRSVWRILERAVRGDLRSQELWREFDRALHGRRLFELDERAATFADAAEDTAPEAVRRWSIPLDPDEYRALGILERRAAELEDPALRREIGAVTHEPIELAGPLASELDPTPQIRARIDERLRLAGELGWIWQPRSARPPPPPGPLAGAPSMADLAAE
jgi:hypothetical protein